MALYHCYCVFPLVGRVTRHRLVARLGLSHGVGREAPEVPPADPTYTCFDVCRLEAAEICIAKYSLLRM